MLRYDVKLTEDNLKRDKLVWSEKFVAPDLSFVSGVTSQHYHIDASDMIAASIGADSNFSSLNIETENVTRTGYVLISGKEYGIQSAKKPVHYSYIDESDTAVTEDYDDESFYYVYINDVYYYITDDMVTGGTITVHNHLKEQWKKVDGEYKVEIVEGDVDGIVDTENGVVKLDTIAWIEGDTVEIDGNKYIYDKYDEGLKYYPAGRALSADEVTYCDGIYYNSFENVSDYQYVTKFKLTKKPDKELEFDKLSFCTYFYFVTYKGYYCPIRQTEDGFVCDIPSRLINGNSEDYSTTTKDVTDMSGSAITVTRISQLKTVDAMVDIEGTMFPVEYLLQNSNYGDEVAIYLVDGSNNLSVGETIVLVEDTDGVRTVPVYRIGDGEPTCKRDECEYVLERYGLIVTNGDTTATDWSDDNDDTGSTSTAEEFVLYKNTKYYVEKNIADTTTIDDVEYDVYYPNGIANGVDALVDIDGDMIPMKIVYLSSLTGETPSTGETVVNVVRYKVNKYDGVLINERIYRVFNGANCSKYIEMDESVPYEFTINYIEGSSLLICTPKLSSYDLPTEFIDELCPQICEYFVHNQNNVKVISENRAFGTKYIKSDIGFTYDDNPLSSNDYYDIFDNLTLFVNSGYIQIPLPLVMNVAMEGLQEDAVKRDFYDAEKEKVINPIVDMEKDVYTPKYISGDSAYSGSSTDFYPINQIEVNLHFRTRDMDSWKVYDRNNDASVRGDDLPGGGFSGAGDNWFCTDFFPYNEIVELPETTGRKPQNDINNKLKDTLMHTSDLMYFLWFTNEDIYYQRDKVGKSFLRFSYYDSPDPNTQSLLATSTVFMDEHALYKKYIDYSKRNINNYGLVTDDPDSAMTYVQQGETEIINVGDVINRISVKAEYLGKKGKKDEEIKTYGVSYITDSGKTGTDIREKLDDDSRRLSCKFIIDNKYATDTSSEGFYLYIFREYSENLHPKPIYMKIEFNHAGVGRTIPFIVPMHWSSGSTDSSNEMFPERKLTLHEDDIDELKGGYPLSFVYAQTYIPLYAVYDFKNKEYAYVFDDRYVTIDEDNKLILNLFELKVATEEYTDESELDKKRADVRNNNITRAVINVSSQFSNIINESNSE